MLEYYQVCSNDDLGLTLTYFTARSNWVPYVFIWEKGKTMDFSETVIVCDVKVGRCSYRVRARIFFSFATTFANLIFFVPISLNLGYLSPLLRMKLISCDLST